jgi:putative transposase
MHIIQRGNNRSACFFADTDYRVYLDWLREYSAQTHCSVHAYVLMTNHVHLLLTAEDAHESPRVSWRLFGLSYATTASFSASCR